MEVSKIQEVTYSAPAMMIPLEQDIDVYLGDKRIRSRIATFYGNDCRKRALQYIKFLESKMVLE
jgi:hypothetical protein